MYVHHFHWRRWPDRGVPQNDLAPLRLLFHVQQFRRSVVHCSAGIGRTGTLVALHIAYDTLQRGQRLNILALARNLRQHRAQSVQTLDQYLYIYFVILRYAQNKAANKSNKFFCCVWTSHILRCPQANSFDFPSSLGVCTHLDKAWPAVAIGRSKKTIRSGNRSYVLIDFN
ncbi:hypothetical protein niasHT_027424 [Heterodera trifolii]|uniref:Uncharacterized protein n=1 Tax=Heterodera trifolii TaxID=157864 RepID=A0ABD2JS06_9BILA